MKKLMAATALLLAGIATLSSCDNSAKREKEIFDQFPNVLAKATIIRQQISVKKGVMLIADEDITYTISTGEKKMIKRTLNPLTAEDPWKIETTVEPFEVADLSFNLDFGSLQNLEMKFSDTVLLGVVAHDKIGEAFNIDASTVVGDVTLRFDVREAEKKKINLQQSYTSAKDNKIVVGTEYQY